MDTDHRVTFLLCVCVVYKKTYKGENNIIHEVKINLNNSFIVHMLPFSNSIRSCILEFGSLE